MNDAKKKEYDPADKWGAPTSSYDDAMSIKKALEKLPNKKSDVKGE